MNVNKKLLMAALAAALVAPLAANAGVKVYGAVQFEFAQKTVQIDDDGIAATGNNDQDTSGYTTLDRGRGRLGIKASEDLGGGLKALAKVEFKLDTTDIQGLGGRTSHVGLKGGFGTFLMGRLKTPYKYFGGIKYDPFVGTNLQARGNGGMGQGASASTMTGGDGGGGYGHNSFQANNVSYLSPNWGGFKLWVTYGLDQKGDDRDVKDTCTDDDGCGSAGGGNFGDYQLGAKFGMKGAVPFEVGFVTNYNNSRDSSTGGLGASAAFKVFASVGFKTGSIKHKIVLQNEAAAESTNDSTAGDTAEALLFLGYHLKIGKTTVVLQTASNVVDYDAVLVDDQTGTYTAVGVIHKFSKKTRVFGGIRNSKWTDFKGVTNAEKVESVITVGLRKDF